MGHDGAAGVEPVSWREYHNGVITEYSIVGESSVRRSTVICAATVREWETYLSAKYGSLIYGRAPA